MARPKIIAIDAQKGGCGKSTTTVQIATTLAHFGKKVLVVDTNIRQLTSQEFLSENTSGAISCVAIPPKSILKQFKSPDLISGYNVVLVDGQGTMDEYSHLPMEVCDYYLTPVRQSQADISSLEKYVTSVIEPALHRRDINGGFFISEADIKTSSFEATSSILDEMELPRYHNFIPRSEHIKTATSIGCSILEYRGTSSAAMRFLDFFMEFVTDAKIRIKNQSAIIPSITRKEAR